MKKIELPKKITKWADDTAVIAFMPKQETTCELRVDLSEYQFSDSFNMPLDIYHQYIEEKRDGEYPTEPAETSEAVFKARAYWEASA